MPNDYSNEVNEILEQSAESGLVIIGEFQMGKYVDVAGKTFPYDLNRYDPADAARYIEAVYVIARRGWCRGISATAYELTAAGFSEARRLREANSAKTPAGNWTTKGGYVNRNGQVVIRDTRLPGTDHGQRIYQIACSRCGHVYGANGSDIHLRKCPRCGGGAEGLKYTV